MNFVEEDFGSDRRFALKNMVEQTEQKKLSKVEVAKHNTKESTWLIIKDSGDSGESRDKTQEVALRMAVDVAVRSVIL